MDNHPIAFFLCVGNDVSHAIWCTSLLSQVSLTPRDIKQGVLKSVGTTNRNVFCDYLGYENYLTTPR